MTEKSDYAGYVRDLAYLLREAAAEARQAKTEKVEAKQFYEGRESALIEALLFMQSQADSFAIPREEFGLDGFDPLTDPLAPPTTSRDL
jgi:hypothetical protein